MTWLSSLLRSVNRNPMRGPRPGRMSARKRCAFQLRLERLEDRLVPTTGTSAGTVLVKDINSGSASSNPAFLTDLNGAPLFGAGGGLLERGAVVCGGRWPLEECQHGGRHRPAPGLRRLESE